MNTLRGTPLGTFGALWEPLKSHTNAFIQPVKVHFYLRFVIRRGL